MKRKANFRTEIFLLHRLLGWDNKDSAYVDPGKISREMGKNVNFTTGIFLFHHLFNRG